MGLTSTLENTWAEMFDFVSESKISNVSLMAFQLGRAIKEKHPNLGFSFNGHHLQSDPAKPNFVIWEKSKKQNVLFFGTLLFEPEERPSSEHIVSHFLNVIEYNNFDVLCNDLDGRGQQYETRPLSPYFEFGLFFICASGKQGYSFRSLWGPMTPNQLSRFHFAQIESDAIGSQKTKSLYRSPPENHEMRRGDEIPDLSFKLNDGREVHVNALIWEPTYSEKKLIRKEGEERTLLAQQKRMKAEEFFGDREVLFLKADYVDADPPRIANTAITAWLSSTPFHTSAIRSELVVVFFLDYSKGTSLEEMLQSSLSDVSWGAHASDANDINIGLWKDNWLLS